MNLIEKSKEYGSAPGLSPQDCYQLLKQLPNCILVDVRTKAEIDWIGKPIMPHENQYMHIEWLFYPGSAQNENFITSLKKISQDTPLIFLCRSGIRSKMAVQLAIDNDFKHPIDVIGGFEGQRDNHGHRKTIDGWCYAGLPWVGA